MSVFKKHEIFNYYSTLHGTLQIQQDFSVIFGKTHNLFNQKWPTISSKIISYAATTKKGDKEVSQILRENADLIAQG